MKVRVATLNPRNNRVEYQYPVDFQKFYYKGKMLNIESKHVSLLVTPEHKLYVRKAWDARKRRPFSFISAMRLPRHVEFKRDADWDGVEKQFFVLPVVQRKSNKGNPVILKNIQSVKMDDWLRFFGVWLAEGSAFMDGDKYKVHISQHDERKKKVILEWSRKCGFNAREKPGGVLIRNKQLYSYLKQFGHAEDKFIPHELKQLGKRQLKILFDSLMFGDGYERESGGWIYGTSSKQLADDIHEIALKLGYVVTIHTRQEGSIAFNKYRRKRSYVLSIAKTHKTPSVGRNKDPRKWINYEGYVYDITVPKYHIIYVRRKGKSIWCSNCKSDGTTLLDYWMEEKVDGDYAVFWVEVDSIPASPDTTTIYIYYGKSDATTTSNGDDTFLVFAEFETDFDGFSGPTVSGYSAERVNDPTQGWCVHVEEITSNHTGNKPAFLEGSIHKEITKESDIGLAVMVRRWRAKSNTSSGDVTNFHVRFSEGDVAASLADYTYLSGGVTDSGWRTETEWRMFTDPIEGYTNLWIVFGFEDRWVSDYYQQVWIDEIRVRKYVDPEPSHGAWGREERRVGIRRLKSRGGDARSRLVFKPSLRM